MSDDTPTTAPSPPPLPHGDSRSRESRRRGATEMARQLVEDLADKWDLDLHERAETGLLTDEGQLLVAVTYEPRRAFVALDAPRHLVEALDDFNWEVVDE